MHDFAHDSPILIRSNQFWKPVFDFGNGFLILDTSVPF